MDEKGLSQINEYLRPYCLSVDVAVRKIEGNDGKFKEELCNIITIESEKFDIINSAWIREGFKEYFGKGAYPIYAKLDGDRNIINLNKIQKKPDNSAMDALNEFYCMNLKSGFKGYSMPAIECSDGLYKQCEMNFEIFEISLKYRMLKQ